MCRSLSWSSLLTGGIANLHLTIDGFHEPTKKDQLIAFRNDLKRWYMDKEASYRCALLVGSECFFCVCTSVVVIVVATIQSGVMIAFELCKGSCIRIVADKATWIIT